MMTRTSSLLLAATALLTLACGGSSGGGAGGPPAPPYPGAPPLGVEILRTDGTVINDGAGADTGWRWIPFDDTTCTTATLVEAPAGSGTFHYELGTSPTGLAINWGSEASTDLVVYLQGGGACWDFFTCGGARSLGIDKTATAGPFGPAEFAADVHDAYPASWVLRANLPAALTDATIVFVPYCTGDVHGGDRVTTYAPPNVFPLSALPSITWHHVGHANVMAYLARLGATFPAPTRLVVAGSSAGGFGTLANYPAFRWYWPDAKAYLIDDSAPPLIANAIPTATRSGWYASWNLGESLDRFCPECRTDMSRGLAELEARYPDDRIALISHLQDEVIRTFYGTFTLSPPYVVPMPAATFSAQLRLLGTSVLDPATANAKYFFTNSPTPIAHPALQDPGAVTTPGAGLGAWLEEMLSDATTWASAADPDQLVTAPAVVAEAVGR
jgi:hypothetical protein